MEIARGKEECLMEEKKKSVCLYREPHKTVEEDPFHLISLFYR